MTRDDYLAAFPSSVAAATFEERVLTDRRPLPAVAARVLADEDYTPSGEYYSWLLGQVSLAATAAMEAAYEAAQQREVQADARAGRTRCST